MALDYQLIFPGQIDIDPGYPQGKARNVTVFGDGTGTPWEEQLLNDQWALQQSLLAEGGEAPSGTPDEVGASQYFDALRKMLLRSAGGNFEQQTPAGGFVGSFFGVAFGLWVGSRTGYVAVGTTGEIQRSEDGRNWEQVAAAGGYANAFTSVATYLGGAGGVQIVGQGAEIQRMTAVGFAPAQEAAAGGFAGDFWRVRFLGGAPPSNTTGQFFAVGAAEEIQWREGGVWMQSNTGGSEILRDIAYSGTIPTSGGAVYNGTFVAVGHNGTILTATDPNGVWTPRTADAAFAGVFIGVLWDGTNFVAFGEGHEIQTSPDGITWTQRRASGGAVKAVWDGVVFQGEIQLHGDGLGATGTEIVNSEILTSKDHGVTWRRRTSGFANNMRAVCQNVFGGVAGGPSNRVMVVGEGANVQLSDFGGDPL